MVRSELTPGSSKDEEIKVPSAHTTFTGRVRNKYDRATDQGIVRDVGYLIGQSRYMMYGPPHRITLDAIPSQCADMNYGTSAHVLH